MGKPLSAPCDFALREDGDLLKCVREHPRAVVVGDPLIGELLGGAGAFVPLVHPAVSSTLCADEAAPCDLADWAAWADGVLARITR